MIRLLSMDLDDTLLRTDKTISPHTLQVLARCQRSGIATVFNTARSETNCLSFIEQARPDFVISSAGAMITQGGKRLWSLAFTPEETLRIIRLGQEIGCEITIDTEDRYYCNSMQSVRNFPADWGIATYSDYADFHEAGIKICMELPNPADAGRIAAALDCDCVRFARGNWYKFSRRGATKEDALEWLGARLGISLDEMAAFGDDFSDIGMLKRCGHGIAMANAVPEVREIADAIAESNDDDGVARWIEANVLNA